MLLGKNFLNETYRIKNWRSINEFILIEDYMEAFASVTLREGAFFKCFIESVIKP